MDVSLAHLDRPFDYLVDERDAATAQPGVRVRVRFAGRLVHGYVLQRLAASDHSGAMAFLERVVSPEPVLSPDVAALAHAVAERYGGTTADVLRLAVPPRHARVEAEGIQAGARQAGGIEAGIAAEPVEGGRACAGAPAEQPIPAGSTPFAPPEQGSCWTRYPAGRAFIGAVSDRRPARAVWQPLPGEDWAAVLAQTAAAVPADAGALLLVPDGRALRRLTAALEGTLGDRPFLALTADLGPAERYRRFLAVRRGEVRVVAGTRAAVFAPVADPALLAIWDDGDDSFAELRAPYPHAREVLMIRSAAQGAALLVGGFARTAEAQLMVESGWAHPVQAGRALVRLCRPRIESAAGDHGPQGASAAAQARLAPAAFAAARTALGAGAPVLVQVPRRGYLPALACGACRRPARCRRCRGPLGLRGRDQRPSCRWCGVTEVTFTCGACGARHLRAATTGAARTAEEIGRAFPGVPVLSSAAPHVRDTVDAAPALVVATPGAEPVAAGGYGAALLLDGWTLLSRPDLRAAEEGLRRWMAAAALVRHAGAGGRVIVSADPGLPAVQALIGWDPARHAAGELASRRELGFPPAVAMASIDGEEQAVFDALATLALPDEAEVLGPVELDPVQPPQGAAAADGGATSEPSFRALVRSPLGARKALIAALRSLAATRSARKTPGTVRIHLDPLDLL